MTKLFFPALLLPVALAACGGGGGGGGSSSAGPTPPILVQAKVQTVPVQRAVASQSLQSVLDTRTTYSFAGGGTATFSVFRRALDRSSRQIAAAFRTGMATQAVGRRTSSVVYGACQNGAESATVNVSSTEQQVYVRTFYDATCVTLHHDVYLDLIATSSAAATANGTDTAYTTGGTVFTYDTIALTLAGVGTANPSISLYVTDAVNQSSPQLAAAGIACGSSAGSLACGFGGVTHGQALSLDEGGVINVATVITGSASTAVNVSISGNGSEYSGALNALTLSASTFPAWAITGGSVVDAATVNGQLSFNSLGAILGGSLALTDSADDGTVNMAAGATGITGVIKQTSTGQQVATFAVDQNGNGTITYSSGVVGQIAAWQITG